MEARGNVTEYHAFLVHNTSKSAVDSCNVSTGIKTAGSQHFIRWLLSTQSSYHVAVMAYTAAGCNSSLVYNAVFIPTQEQGVHPFQFACALH